MIIKTYPTYSLKITLFEQISLNFKYHSLNMWWSINKLAIYDLIYIQTDLPRDFFFTDNRHLAIISKKIIGDQIIFG